MASNIQDGIFYDREKDFKCYSSTASSFVRNKTWALLFLRAGKKSAAENIFRVLEGLWERYQFLKRGLMEDLPGCKLPTGSLHVLMAYGPSIFKLNGIKKNIPNDMKDMQFLQSKRGGGPILTNSGIKFATDIHNNVGLSEYMAIQFIGDSQLSVYRAIVETDNYLKSQMTSILKLTKFFTGFQRDDHRSWLGFHDEVSNMKNSREAIDVISINSKYNHLSYDDLWTSQGTYLTFLRTLINLNIWNKVTKKEQELIVGREKKSGRPLIGVDKKGNPLIDVICPKFTDIIEYRKEFHDHPHHSSLYDSSRSNRTIDINASLKVLNLSHIGRVRHIESINSGDPASNRIFRQGFDFMEASDDMNSPIRVGQNFVSFQNDPARIFSILTDPNWMGRTNFGGDSKQNGMANLLSVTAAGVFLVPPKGKPFPGAILFK